MRLDLSSQPQNEEIGRSDDFRFDFDITAPETPAMEDVSVSDSNGNPLNRDDATNSREITFCGNAEEGDIVRLYSGDELIGSVRVGPDGTWSIPVSDLPQGNYQFRTEIEDRAGNVSEKSDSFDVEVDLTPPEKVEDVSISDGLGGALENGDALNTGELTFSGTAEAGAIVYLWEGDAVVGSVLVDSSGNWQLPAEMSEERSYSFRTEVRDPAGNSSGLSAPVELSYDVTPPTPVGDTTIYSSDGCELHTGDATNDKDLTFSGSGLKGEIVYLWDGAVIVGSTTVGDNGEWSIPAEMLNERAYNFQVEIRDAAGNSSGKSDPLTVEFDITPPATVSIGSVEKDDGSALGNSDFSNDNTPLFRGTGTHGDIVYLTDNITGQVFGSALVNEFGLWEILPDVAMDDGSFSLRVDVTDPAGNKQPGTDIFTLHVDTLAPGTATNVGLTSDYGADDGEELSGRISGDNTPTLSGGAGSVEGGSWVWIVQNGTEMTSVKAESDGSWRYTSPELANGEYQFSVIVEDLAGNRSGASAPIAFEIERNVTDFDDNSLQGWSWGAAYQGIIDDPGNGTGIIFTKALEIWTPGSRTGLAGDVITNTLDVKAGMTYHFSFEVTNITTLVRENLTSLGLMVDGALVIPYQTVDAQPGSKMVLTGSYTATSDGQINLTIVNETDIGTEGNNFMIDNIIIATSGEMPVVPFSFGDASHWLYEDAVLDFSQVSADNDALHQIDLSGYGNNTLNLSLGDLLAFGQEDLFMADGAKQMMITGDAGDVVNLSDMLPDGADVGDWNNSGIVTIGGVEYQVYQHSGLDADLLVQQNLTVNLDNH